MGDVMNREEFKTLFLILYKKWEKWGKYTTAYGVGWYIWQYQQKIINELKAENFAMSAMICKHSDKRIIDENYDSTKDYCDILQAENPDVPCPAGCDEDGQLWFWDGRHCICPVCKGKTTIPLTKAQEYRIKELEG